MSPTDVQVFFWKGKPLGTIGALLDGAVDAEKEEQAPEFLAAYRAANEHADANLGYIIGYLDEDSRRRMYAAYDLTHPTLGGRP